VHDENTNLREKCSYIIVSITCCSTHFAKCHKHLPNLVSPVEALQGIQTGLSALKHEKTETKIAKQGSYLETKQKRKRCSQKVFVLSNHEKKTTNS